MPIIRAEKFEDVPSVHELNALVFPTKVEANLADVLRETARPMISLVAEEKDTIVGHIMFTPAELSEDASLNVMALAPMAVAPDRQNQGIGSQLVEEGLNRCEDIGVGAVVVVGHPSFYTKFGFVPASAKNIRCEFDVPDDVFMIRELDKGCLADVAGTIRYYDAFGELT